MISRFRCRVHSGWHASMFWKHWRKVVKHCWHYWKHSCTIRWSIGLLARTPSGPRTTPTSSMRLRRQQRQPQQWQRHPIVLEIVNWRLAQTAYRRPALPSTTMQDTISKYQMSWHETHWPFNLLISNQSGYKIGQFTHARTYAHTHTHCTHHSPSSRCFVSYRFLCFIAFKILCVWIHPLVFFFAFCVFPFLWLPPLSMAEMVFAHLFSRTWNCAKWTNLFVCTWSIVCGVLCAETVAGNGYAANTNFAVQ